MAFAYDPPVFRPPSEADSLILQVTLGCSHNRCTFCSMYRTKSFRAKAVAEVRDEIVEARRLLGPDVRRVFLADGDAMCLSTDRLVAILDALHAAFPRIRRVGSYANARDLLHKTPEELAELHARRLSIVYLGLESGDDETLASVEKGATVDESVAAVRRAAAAGMSTSVMVLAGLAGRARSEEHARRSAEAVNRMEPSFTALLTYTPTPGSPLAERVARGEVELPDALESLREIRTFVDGLRCSTYFTCNHASNWLPLTGRLPAARGPILQALDAAIDGRIALKPAWLRAL